MKGGIHEAGDGLQRQLAGSVFEEAEAEWRVPPLPVTLD